MAHTYRQREKAESERGHYHSGVLAGIVVIPGLAGAGFETNEPWVADSGFLYVGEEPRFEFRIRQHGLRQFHDQHTDIRPAGPARIIGFRHSPQFCDERPVGDSLAENAIDGSELAGGGLAVGRDPSGFLRPAIHAPDWGRPARLAHSEFCIRLPGSALAARMQSSR